MILLSVVLLSAFLPAVPQHDVPASHPRLLGGAAEFAAIRASVTNETCAAAVRGVADRARAYPQCKPLTRKMAGRRLLAVAREALARISFCAMDARLHGTAASRALAVRTMREVVAFPDWNPGHFLDVAEMSLAVSLGYDWLHPDLAEEDRQLIAAGLKRHGFDEMYREAFKPSRSRLFAHSNWGQVCSAGAIAVALALWDEEGPRARELLERAVEALHVPMAVYAPKGCYPEGPGYWNYGTTFNVLALGLLEHALGTDCGLSRVKGFRETASFLDWTTGPTGEMFNYSDSGLKRGATTAAWWFAAHGSPDCVDVFERKAVLAAAENPKLALPRTFPCALFWMPDVPERSTISRSRVWSSDDPTGVVVLRTDWSTNAWFVALKGGLVGANHGHMDVGSFVFEAEGVRWAGDIGSENYGRIEAAGIGLWNMDQASERWGLYRLANASHNVLSPEGVRQNVRTSGQLLSARDAGSSLEAAFRLDAIYAPVLKGWTRQVRLTPKALEVTDEVSGTGESRLVWGFSTRASAEVRGDTVVLTARGRRMSVSASGVAGAVWTIGPAKGRHPHDGRNRGWTRVSLALPSAKALRLTVRFCRPAESVRLADARSSSVFGTGVALSARSAAKAECLAIEGERLYVGGHGTLSVYDVSKDPLHPAFLGETREIATARQVAVQDGIAYVVARANGLWIVDCRRPDRPVVSGHYPSLANCTGVDVCGDVCFIGGSRSGIELVDVSDPTRPRLAGAYKQEPVESQSVAYRDGYLYSGEWGAKCVSVWDCRDLRQPRRVSQVALSSNGDGVWPDGKWLYASTGWSKADKKPGASARPGQMGLEVFDLADPARPVRTGRVDFDWCRPKGVDMWIPRACGNLVFAAQNRGGLYAVDVADKTAPRLLDRWQPETGKDGCLASVALGRDVVYVAGPGIGARALEAKGAFPVRLDRGQPPSHVAEARVAVPSAPEGFHRWLPTDGSLVACVTGVAVKDDVCYAAAGTAGLFVLELSKAGVRELGRIPLAECLDVSVASNRLFAAAGRDGWIVYALDDPIRPRELARLPGVGARDVYAYGDGCRWAGLNTSVYDISDLARPRPLVGLVEQARWNKFLSPDLIGGRWVAGNSSLKHFAWADLAAGEVRPLRIGGYAPRGGGICAFGAKALAVDCGKWAMLEPGSTDSPAFVPFPEKNAAVGLPRWNGGNLVSVSGGGARADVWDFTDPLRPVRRVRYRLPGPSDAAAFWNVTPVFPAHRQGVLVPEGI